MKKINEEQQQEKKIDKAVEQRLKQKQNTKKLFKKLLKTFATPPNMTVSEWADNYRILSRESSSEPGRWITDRAPYQREIMDCLSDSKVQKVVLMTSAQVGKTEIMLNLIGYHIDYDPSPMMYIMPTDSMAKTFSEDRLAPMIRDCPTISEKVADYTSRTSGNTIYHKKFAGGHITMIGANAPSQLASRPIRILLADEIDRFPVSAGDEGDPLQLAIKRTTTFWNRKIVEVSTPTIKGASKIEKEYESSDMGVLHVKCPSCGEWVSYEWEDIKFTHESGTTNFELQGMQCRHCGAIHTEREWKAQPIKWIAQHPEITKVRGFHLNEFASPWKTWNEIVEEFLEAKRQGPNMVKVWHNTTLGLSWEDDAELDTKDIIKKRRKFYNCPHGTFVPKDVLVITVGVDVQDNRLEYEMVGWGKDKVSYGLKYGVIMGEPGQGQVWKELDEVILATYKREDGLDLKVGTTCIDSGGHYTESVYNYCAKREANRVWAIKGQGGSGIPYIKRPNKKNRAKCYLFIIGVDVGKDVISSRLKVAFPSEPGFCNFPMEEDRGYDENYFNGLTSERRNIRTVNGRIAINWVKKYEGIRNEPFDCRNYATAALEIANPNLDYIYELYNGSGEKKQNQEPTTKHYGVVNKGIDLY